ncbi:hypothetical protein GS421_17380, partial [Rhodococcus hoagii]|nr:hypothetical protein [Prescottella equi]
RWIRVRPFICGARRRRTVLIERLDSAHQLRAFLPLGTRLPLHAASNGKAYLASLPDSEVERILASDLALRPVAPSPTRRCLRQEIEEIRRRGYAVTDQGLHDGIAAVAVALRGRGGVVRGCFSVSGPASRLTPTSTRSMARRRWLPGCDRAPSVLNAPVLAVSEGLPAEATRPGHFGP